MTTILKRDGHIVLPPTLRKRRKLKTGDELEIWIDEDEPNVIMLRRVSKVPDPSWVDVLLACPQKGWFRRMPRRKEPMRKVRL